MHSAHRKSEEKLELLTIMQHFYARKVEQTRPPLILLRIQLISCTRAFCKLWRTTTSTVCANKKYKKHSANKEQNYFN
jgi:hypothetical protein